MKRHEKGPVLPMPGDKSNKLRFVSISKDSTNHYDTECECGVHVRLPKPDWGTQKGCRPCGTSKTFVMYEGRMTAVSVVCEKLGIPYTTAKSRIDAGEPETDWFRPVYGDDGLCTIKRNRRIKDKFVGKRFGRWIVLDEPPDFNGYFFQLKCRCECGFEKLVDSSHLTRGRSKSCGCLVQDKPPVHNGGMASYASEYPIGAKFRNLTIISEITHTIDPKRRQKIWRVDVRCDCGVEKTVRMTSIRNQGASSCGCMRSDTSQLSVDISPNEVATIEEIAEEFGTTPGRVRIRLLSGVPAQGGRAKKIRVLIALKTGLKFGDWTVAAPDKRHSEPPKHCLCVCACGTKRVVALTNLASGASKSCGCRRRKAA